MTLGPMVQHSKVVPYELYELNDWGKKFRNFVELYSVIGLGDLHVLNIG